MSRRLLALALATVVLDPLAPIVGAWSAERPCRDHVCLCARHCPPRQSAAHSCHEPGAETTGVRAACHHDEASSLTSIAPALLPAGARLAAATSFVLADAAPAQDPAPGFDSVLSPPPKSS
jgi:hypothetical protein